MALIAACIIDPAAYFSMNSPMSMLAPVGTSDVVASAAQIISSWGFHITPETLINIANEVGEKSIISRTGGAPTLAVGMAYLLHSVFSGLLNVTFWYHFAILFEALFILTAIDAGTRAATLYVARFIRCYITTAKKNRFITCQCYCHNTLCVNVGIFSLSRYSRSIRRYQYIMATVRYCQLDASKYGINALHRRFIQNETTYLCLGNPITYLLADHLYDDSGLGESI